MNIHHLELFYYVATHQGISRAVRHMPYGIQQPAVSSQILQLEEEIGARLFERAPFKLTSVGEELYASIQPFFGSLDELAERVSRNHVPRLAIAAAEFALAEHLPVIVQRIKAKHPKFRLGLRSGYQAQMEEWLVEKQIDLAITPLEKKPTTKVTATPLLSLPLVLLAPRGTKLKHADELLVAGSIEESLISLPPTESVSRLFQQELKRRKIEWAPAIEASSLSVLSRYVENGYGYGLTVLTPDAAQQRGVKVLPLAGFPLLEIFALWQGEGTPLVRAAVEECQRYVREQWPNTLQG